MKTGFEEIIDDIQCELDKIETQLEHTRENSEELLHWACERDNYQDKLSRAQQAHEDCSDAERQGL